MAHDAALTVIKDLQRLIQEIDSLQEQLDEASSRYSTQLALYENMRALYPDWFVDDEIPDLEPAAGSDDVEEQEPEQLRGREAVLAIMKESGLPKMSTVAVLKEMHRRGWAAPNDPEGSVRAALRRLVDDGQLVKLDEREGRSAVYRLKVAEDADTPGEPGVSVPTNSSAVAAAGPDSEGGDGDDDDRLDLHPAPVAGAS